MTGLRQPDTAPVDGSLRLRDGSLPTVGRAFYKEGVAVPVQKPAFFQSDRRPKWLTQLTAVAVGLRLRFRRNPGFTMATVAGSAGLVLALILLLNGGMAYFSKSKDVEEIAETGASLGEESPSPDVDVELADSSRSPAGESLLPPLDRKRENRIEPAKEKVSSWHRDESFLSEEESEADEPQVSVVSRSTETKATSPKAASELTEDPFNGDEQKDLLEEEDEHPAIPATSKPLSSAISGLHSDSEESDNESAEAIDEDRLMAADEPIATQSPPEKPRVPLESKTSAPVEKTREPLFADDDRPGDSQEEEQSTPPQTGRGSTTVVRTPARSSPPVPPVVENDFGETFSPPQEKALEPSSPPASAAPRSGWKYSTTKPRKPASEPATESANESPMVETAVYAAPEAKPATPEAKPAVPVKPAPVATPKEQRDASLKLAIKAPQNVGVGQTFDLEFTVTNTGPSPIQGALLSVYLPGGLQHSLGPDLEKPIGQLVPGQSYRSRLTVKATGAGDVTPKADVTVKGQAGARSTTTLRVGSTRAAGPARLPDCACEPAARYVW